MCGRFTLVATEEEYTCVFDLALPQSFAGRYNIAPTQPVELITHIGYKRHNMIARWGLIPAWCKNPDDFPLLINARSETAFQKASFKAAMRHRRALMPASGFYEWRRPQNGKGQSQAFFVRPKGGGLVGLAALWESWMGPDGTQIDTAAIMTTKANETFMPIHHRLPVVIKQDDFDNWLDVVNNEPRHVQPLLEAADEDFWEAIAVGDAVNKVSNNGPEIQNRVEEKDNLQSSGPEQMSLF